MSLSTRLSALTLTAAFLILPLDGGAQATRRRPAAPAPKPAADPSGPVAPVFDERKVYLDAARIAWNFVDRNYQATTGLARAHDTYQFVTLWDIASSIAATYSAHELGIIPAADYDKRITAILRSLTTMDLFDRAAFNKAYASQTARMIDRDQKPSSRGYGWSATDLGRLLLWLRILAVNHPQYAPQAEAIVKRLDMTRLIKDGYLQGHDLHPRTGADRKYQESRIGYEQYAASGFAVWGHRAENALDARVNAIPVDVNGLTIFADKRGSERITSEPYIMMGMETGWYTPELREQAWRVLAAQEARYKSTGIITMVSEDALPDPPFYFYYYNLYREGKPFVVDAPAGQGYVDKPRWVSSKAAFAWHALLPTPYTLIALQAVQSSAIGTRGWGAGVYEQTLKPTGDASLNTAALILEAALFNSRGRPFLWAKIF